jgi:hypothetical protein
MEFCERVDIQEKEGKLREQKYEEEGGFLEGMRL